MNFRTAQVNFSRGEIAPALRGRFDVDAWASGLKKARNVIVLKYGGVTKRPGTRLVGEVLDFTADNRILPFQFSLTQTYALEMGQGYMSPCALGGRLIEEEIAITGVTNAANAQITAAYHGLVVGDYWYITGVAGELGDFLNGRKWKVMSVVDANNFTIDADTSALDAFINASGGIVRGSAPVPPTPPVVPPPVAEEALPDVAIGAGGDFYRWGSF